MIGQTVSHYKILEKLGEGGMGVVYRAHDTELDRDVALKFLPNFLTGDARERERFYHEARAASALNHPNVTTIHEIKEFDHPAFPGKQLYLAMEYVEGKTLRDIVVEMQAGGNTAEVKPPPTMHQILDIAIQACEGLAAAHEKGIVHRDIKSANLMVTPKGQVKIMDFGLAKVQGATKLTMTGSTIGTAAYMSPEQARGEEVDHRTDIFSFGVVLYELLTARLPFRGEHPTALMYSIVNEEPQPLARFNEKVTPEIERIVAKALVKDREERYQHADDMLADLRHERKKLEYARTGYVSAAKATVSPPTARTFAAPSKRNSLKVGIGVFAIIILIGLALIFNPFGLEVTPKKAAAARQKTIAVLPFTNIGGGQEDGFFCDGMTEDIQTQLSKIADVSVISRNSTIRFKGSTKSISEIGAELGAGTILQGNIRRSGTRVRIVAQLVDAASDRQIWAENYDREMKDIFDIQSDVAQAIASALRATLTPAEKINIENIPTDNLDAYAYCVKGREYYYRYTAEGLKEAEKLFQRAIALDSNYAAAYAGLSDVYATGSSNFPLWDKVDTAIQLSQVAIGKDSRCAEAYKALGLAYEVKGWFSKAINETRKAIEINPNYGPAISNLGDELLQNGQALEGMRSRLRATRLDPLMAWRYVVNGFWYHTWGDDQNARKQFTRALELQPDLMVTYDYMWGWHAEIGNLREALSDVKKIFQAANDTTNHYKRLLYVYSFYTRDIDSITHYYNLYLDREPGGRDPMIDGYIETRKGHLDSARKILANAIEAKIIMVNSGHEKVDIPFDIACCQALSGNKKEAYRWLIVALSKTVLNPRRIDSYSFLDNLRNDAEYINMMSDYRSRMDLIRQQVLQLGNQ